MTSLHFTGWDSIPCLRVCGSWKAFYEKYQDPVFGYLRGHEVSVIKNEYVVDELGTFRGTLRRSTTDSYEQYPCRSEEASLLLEFPATTPNAQGELVTYYWFARDMVNTPSALELLARASE